MLGKFCKVVAASLFVLGLGFGVSSQGVADEISEPSIEVTLIEEKQNENEAIPFTENYLENLMPGGGLLRGASRPTANWNVTTKGPYNMQGSWGAGNYLYSNYNVTGSNYYPFYFINEGKSDIEIKLRHSTSHATLDSLTLKRGYSINYLIHLTDTSSRFYFEFYSKGDFVFSGWVKDGK